MNWGITPRLRETRPQILCVNAQRGITPRLRETLPKHKRFVDRLGITPAPAGNTISETKFQGEGKDHPRACGKHLGVSRQRPPFEGSPPRLRETPWRFPTTPSI